MCKWKPNKAHSVCFLLICILTINICIGTAQTEGTLVGYETYSWDNFVNFTGLNLFESTTLESRIGYADAIMNGSLIVNEDFSGPEYSFEALDWNMQYSDSPNTFQLYLQGLGSVQLLSEAYHMTHNSAYLAAAKNLTKSWDEYRLGSETAGNPYVWNDHGTAIRAHSLVMLAMASEEAKEADEIKAYLYNLLAEHAEFLADDAHYTRNHNHGIMQDAALLEVAYLLSSDPDYMAKCESWRTLAKERLDEQRRHAFSSEMVHVENSIGYHLAVTDLFAEVAQFLKSMGDSEAAALSDSLKESREFAAWAIMPNGVYATFGDSFRVLKEKAHVHIIDSDPSMNFESSRYYPISGYWFYRGWNADDAADSTWKLFKAGYSSGTHKHADDCSFILYGQGTEIFIDPGMYNYMTGNPYRDYLLTSSAHNTVTVDEKSYSPTTQNAEKTGLLYCNSSDNMDYILAFNDMYSGAEIDRHFYSSGDLTVLFDDVVSNESHTYSQLFHLFENISVSSESPEETLIPIGDNGYRVRIRQLIPTDLSVFCGRDDAVPLYGHTGSKEKNCETLRYQQHAISTRFITVITIEDADGQVLLKNGSHIHYSDISLKDDQLGLRIGEEEILFAPRVRFYPHSDARVEGTTLRLSFPPDPEECQYAIYLINAKTLNAVYKGTFSQERTLSLDLSEYSGEDLLIRTYVKSNRYPQRKHMVTAALVWDNQCGQYFADDGTVYPYLNFERLGQSMEKTGGNSYLFTIDYRCSFPVQQRWYIYRNGGYYTNFTTVDENTLSYTFTEPGDYTVMYYLKTKLGDNEFWNFDQIHVE